MRRDGGQVEDGVCLMREETDGIAWWTDVRLREDHGIVVAFSERTGGTSEPPFDSLNLAAHAGDAPDAVDSNRERLLTALGLRDARARLTTAEQVHGARVVVVGDAETGSGAFAAEAPPPVAGADGLVTTLVATPLMLLYADCVPIVLAATTPRRAVAVLHAGWRGAAAGIVPEGVAALAREAGCAPSDIAAYVGPRIGPCHYEVGDEVFSRFPHDAATIAPARGRLDLGAAVTADLVAAGVRQTSIAVLGACTVEENSRFFSYRAEQRTGRHAALGSVLE
jgi:YfiH family protein